MYTCITDPETGRRIYADIAMVRIETTNADGTTSYKVERVEVLDVVTEDSYLERILFELRGHTIRDRSLLRIIMKEYLNISVDTCPGLVERVEQRLNSNVSHSEECVRSM